MRVETIGDATLYLGDCRDVLPTLPRAGAVVTDPPYGIKQDKGFSGKGCWEGRGNVIHRRQYAGGWDDARPGADIFRLMLDAAPYAIIWGGNYFSDLLPVSGKWLWWDKLQTMPTYGDGELAWTNLPGVAPRKFVYSNSGLMARERDRQHPTQKPKEVMAWCLDLLPAEATDILDPFMGSGTTGVACVGRGLKFTGVELDPNYFDIACRRIEHAYSQPRLFVEAPPKLFQAALF